MPSTLALGMWSWPERRAVSQPSPAPAALSKLKEARMLPSQRMAACRSSASHMRAAISWASRLFIRARAALAAGASDGGHLSAVLFELRRSIHLYAHAPRPRQ